MTIEVRERCRAARRYFGHRPAGRAEELGRAFVLLLRTGRSPLLHTSSTSVQLAELPAQTMRKLPRYPLVRRRSWAGSRSIAANREGYGSSCWRRSYRAARSEIASFAVIVDAKDDGAALL